MLALLILSGCSGGSGDNGPPAEECDGHGRLDDDRCDCDDEYLPSKDGSSCVRDDKTDGTGGSGNQDTDECARGTHDCDDNATCTDTKNSFTCACKDGFEGDGQSCADIDECATDHGGCDPLSMCVNSPGSFTCGSCPYGYSGDGASGCVDIDECEAKSAGCDPLATCTNTEGSFTCGECPEGYTGGSESGCVDIDECLNDNGSCDPLATCMNNEGSFTCGACPIGYAGDGEAGCFDTACAADSGDCGLLAPESQTFRILQDVHTDAVSTFLDGDKFVLATKADVDGRYGVRFEADEVWFYVAADSEVTLAAGFEFIAPEGTVAWVAPESNPNGTQLWPGFSTDSIPAGTFDGDEVTLTLRSAEGPGQFELFTNGLGGVSRLWSSDDPAFSSFSVGRTHMHANWAFTAEGVYRLVVGATALQNGTPVSALATYAFLVGGESVPVARATEISLSASEESVIVNDFLTLSATVSPGDVGGWVKFTDVTNGGNVVLGYAPVASGMAELTFETSAIGRRLFSAKFVPRILNYEQPSTSTPVEVRITDESGQLFEIVGIAPSYAVGDTLTATVVGYELGEGTAQSGREFVWVSRPVGHATNGDLAQYPHSADYLKDLTLDDDGIEFSVIVRDCAEEYCYEGVDLSQTPWVTVHVEQIGGVRPVLTVVSGNPHEFYPGDKFRLEASELNLAENETAQWVRRNFGSSGWSTVFPPAVGVTRGETWLEALGNLSLDQYGDIAIRVLRDGVPVRQSEPLMVTQARFEVLVQGLQGLYMEGATMSLSAQIYPARASDADFTYKWVFAKDVWFETAVVLAEGAGAPTLEQVLNMADHDGGYLRLEIHKPGYEGLLYDYVGVSEAKRIYVTNDPNAQLFLFGDLANHYHQGESIHLNLAITPGLLEGDQIYWEWQWPGSDWVPLPGASGTSHALTAEQALDDVQVRAVLDFAAEGKESVFATAATIYVDDHGALARQVPSVTGATR